MVPGVVYSYPSGHVLEALTIFGIIAILLWRTDRYRWLAAAFAVFTVIFVALVAVARVALNAHYPSDVLGGMLAGIGVLAAFALLVPRRSPAPHSAGGRAAAPDGARRGDGDPGHRASRTRGLGHPTSATDDPRRSTGRT